MAIKMIRPVTITPEAKQILDDAGVPSTPVDVFGVPAWTLPEIPKRIFASLKLRLLLGSSYDELETGNGEVVTDHEHR